jgi:iron complex outermembrane recepter protein
MNFRKTCTATAVASLVLSGASHAQTTSDARQTAAAPETVTITASGREQSASKAPYNVTALTEEMLREANITDAKKLIAQSIGISAPENSARFADSVTVRGLNVSPVNANNIEQFVRTTLSYYIDDTPLPNLGYRIKDIARVETLLGPQGTLYGAGSLGGTIRYITNKPKLGSTEGKVNLSLYQTQGGGISYDLDAVVNVPIAKTLALRVAAARLDEKGYTDRVSNPPWRTGSDAWVTQPDAKTNVYADDDWQRVNGGRISLLWRPARGVDVLFAHTRQDQLANGTTGASLLPLGVANARNAAERDAAWKNPGLGLTSLPCNPNCTYTDDRTTPLAVNERTVLSRYAEFADRRFRLNSIDIDADLGFAKLHSATSEFKDSRIGQADYASQGWTFYYSLGDLGGSITSGRSAYMTFDNTYKGVNHETRLTSTGQGPFSWIAGIYYTQQDKSLKFSEVLPGMDAFLGKDKATKSPLPDVGYSEDLSSKYRETALYGETSYRITAPWSVTAGARVFNYSDTGGALLIDYAGGFVDNNVTANGSASGKAYYKLNSAYEFNKDLLGYITFSQGFRRGGTNPFKTQGSRVIAEDARNYKPDSTNNYEIGLKGYALNRDLYIEASLYRIDWKDAQTYRSQDVDGFPVNGTANGPDARTRGLELNTRYRIGSAWQVSYKAATSEGEWVGTKTQCLYLNNTSCRTWEKGGQLGGTPKWTHELGLRFESTLANNMFLWSTLNARYTSSKLSDRSDSVTENASVYVYPSYTRVNAAVGLGRDAWEAQLWVENLGNSKGIVSNQAAGLMGRTIITTKPRTIGANFSYNF